MNESGRVELFSRYSGGSISEEESAELLALYRNNPDELKQAVRELAIHDLLESISRQEELGRRIKRSVAFHVDTPAANELVKTRVIEALNRHPATAPTEASRIDPRRPMPILLALAASALIAFGVWRLGLETVNVHPVAQTRIFVSSVAQGATFVRGGTSKSVENGAELKPGDLLQTGMGGAVVLKYASEATSVTLMENGEIILSGDSTEKRIKLNRGKISCNVARQQPERPMVFLTPETEVTLLGTRLELATDAASTRLDVSDGKVEFRFSGSTNSTVVSAGEYAEARTRQGEIVHYGEVLFREDFRSGLDAWNMTVNDKPAEGADRARVSISNVHGQPGRKCLQLDAVSASPDEAVKIQYKKAFNKSGIVLLLESTAMARTKKGKTNEMSWTLGLDGVPAPADTRILIDKPIPPATLGLSCPQKSEYLIHRTNDGWFILEERHFHSGTEVRRVETKGISRKDLSLFPNISVRNGTLQISTLEIRRIQLITQNR